MQMMHIASKHVRIYIVETRMQKKRRKREQLLFQHDGACRPGLGGGQNIEYRMVSRAYIGGGGKGTTRSIIRVVTVRV